jgi:hypothetical protein
MAYPLREFDSATELRTTQFIYLAVVLVELRERLEKRIKGTLENSNISLKSQ